MGGTRWGFVLVVISLIVLHFVLRIGLGWGQLAPDLIVAALLIAAREMRADLAAGLGLLLGVLEGSVIPFTLGSSAIALTILGYLGARTRDLVAGDSLLFLAFYLFAGKWLFDLLLYLATGAIIGPEASSLLLISPLAALYVAAVGVLTLSLYRVAT
ncbi:MAG: hypothetical protein H0W11_03165 [Gemmatimonadetes bacterium]|jgi:cell shape-determining protein MreD|nr:hypothetical protein [Gemmatimonadota bacterium]